ncbi:hypothetical protein HDV01_007351 [Terramyces sp. JEL0728]|nr:hypothetical protein HDV01_007351 [Terramyces sp. JEL0728]
MSIAKYINIVQLLKRVLPIEHFKLLLLRIQSAVKNLQTLVNEQIGDNGALQPIVELFSSSQLQSMLLAWIPVKYGARINTGIFAVDMFVTTTIATIVVSLLRMSGKIGQLFLLNSSPANTNSLTIKVDYHRITTWGDKTVNSHYEALLWLVSKLSSKQKVGDYRMIVTNDYISKDTLKKYLEKNPIAEDDGLLKSVTSQFNHVENVDDMSVLDYNLLPRDDAKISIHHEGREFLVWFDQEETDKGNQTEKIHSEPSLIVQKVPKAGSSAPSDTTIEEMHEWLLRITRLYKRYLDNFDERYRYEYDPENGWTQSNTLHVSRGLGAVSLDRSQERLLKKDLETFVQDRDFYTRMGMPYRRGYLLSGKPGTGKTSLINAISASYKKNLYYVNLKEIKNDAALQSAFSNISKNSIAVFEDVDAQSSIVHARKSFNLSRLFKDLTPPPPPPPVEEKDSTDGEDMADGKSDKSMDVIGPRLGGGMKFGGPSLSTLLNCLDGYTLNDGVIIIMTTNHPELLDPALIRPGRIDLHLELGYCTHYQLNHMYRNVMDMKDEKDSLSDSVEDATIVGGELDLGRIPEHILPPCDAMRILLLFRTESAQFISQKLHERCEELLSGKAVGDPMDLELQEEMV